MDLLQSEFLEKKQRDQGISTYFGVGVVDGRHVGNLDKSRVQTSHLLGHDVGRCCFLFGKYAGEEHPSSLILHP
jgi:hypothetical protein